MSNPATSEELQQYRNEGYFVRSSVFSADEAASLREATESVHAQIVAAALRGEAEPIEWIDGKRYQKVLGSSVQWEWNGSDEIRSMEPYHHLEPRLDALINDERLWGPVTSIIGCEKLSLFSDKLNFKRPGGAPFPWHQDNPYWAFLCNHLDQLVSLLVALDDANVDNGCLWVIPGSHRHGALPCFEERGVVGRLYTDLERIEGLAEPVPLEVPTGSVVYFHGDVVHGNQGNKTDESRRALLLTYQPADQVRWQRDDVRPVT